MVATDTIGLDHGQTALERFRSAVPNAEVEEVQSGHDLLADAPAETIAAIVAFLAPTSPRDVAEA